VFPTPRVSDPACFRPRVSDPAFFRPRVFPSRDRRERFLMSSIPDVCRGARTHAKCHLVLWGGTPVPRPTPSSASSDLGSITTSRARAPGAAQGSRPTKIMQIWES